MSTELGECQCSFDVESSSVLFTLSKPQIHQLESLHKVMEIVDKLGRIHAQVDNCNYDFANLSRGEKTRLILSLSWAFRDVFEASNSKINLMFIDELVDQGLDGSGTEKVLKILKDMTRTSNKNIFLISHRDEYVSRIPTVLKVTKENRFTTLSVHSTQQ